MPLLSKFHVNIVTTGSGIMAIFTYKRFDQKTCNLKDPSEFCLYLKTRTSQGYQTDMGIFNE